MRKVYLGSISRQPAGWVWAFVLLLAGPLAGQQPPQNVILVTIDGLRWQEVFGGADPRLLNRDLGGVRDVEETRRRFWDDSATVRRQTLLPFLWQTVAARGQVFGQVDQGGSAKVTNGRYFSYPGYNEILSGFADEQIDSNAKIPNRNTTVLEWLNGRPGFQGSVAAFASWDVFPFILNQQRSGIYVNAGWAEIEVFVDEQAGREWNRISRELPRYWSGVRYDAFTIHAALEYLRVHQPRVLYVALGETDDWAHDGRYDLYLDAAQRSDRYIRQLWETAQQLAGHRGKTTLIVTTDHGRGDVRDGWKSHGTTYPGSDNIWIAALGPRITPSGERVDAAVTQSQVAASVAAAVGEDFASSDPRVAGPLPVSQEAESQED